jgi:diaminohydroxyphosphoribosylaminopyrimidine deaminase/5-amino-6-(5-phosphoribosylamino)uracil reductase
MSGALDRLFMQRACELARRARGNVAPNPLVGAVVVREGRVVGEGFHHCHGKAHAEVEALRVAGDARGATVYVTLEPCDHQGLTPPCTRALLDAGVARVVVGTLDPNPKTSEAGVRRLREGGVTVEVLEDAGARALVEDFAITIKSDRPFVTLKLASSLDGYAAPHPGKYQLTGERAAEFTRSLRIAHDAVMVGAGTVRADDPLLTVRPPYARLRPYVRVVACENAAMFANRRIFTLPDPAREGMYAPTIVLAPAGLREGFTALERMAEVVYVGDADARSLDLHAGLVALKARGIHSVLSEGGPTIASRLLAQRLVDRLHWLTAPVLLANENAVRIVRPFPDVSSQRRFRFDEITRLGHDVLFSVSFMGEECSRV